MITQDLFPRAAFYCSSVINLTLPLCLCFKPQHTETNPFSILVTNHSHATDNAGKGDFSNSFPFIQLWLTYLDSRVLPHLCETQNLELHLPQQTPKLLVSDDRSRSPTGLPKNSQRKTDGQGRNSQRTIRGESSRGEQLSTYLGKSCRQVPPPLCAFFLNRRQALAPSRCLEQGLLVFFFFFSPRAGSVGLHFYAFLSEFSQGNSSW